MEIESMLYERIAQDFENIKGMEVGSEEYKNAAATLNQFMDRAIEMEKIHVDKEDKLEIREDERKDRLIKNIFTGVNVLGGIVLVIWGTNKTIKFEETGTITTSAGKKFTNKIFSWLR